MRQDGFNPFGSGPSPIGPRDILDLLHEAEHHLARADRALFLARGCDRSVTAEPSAELPK